ncbi:MAG: hypothetical protein O3A95_07645 [Planctomycetota bacterium]|nr:hypothetical protein [Planctomycetota bacterium]MDA1114154.1 hypothetical protein [Planctomycetota bacterium]
MKSLLLFLCAFFAVPSVVLAQDSSAVPVDAKQLLQLHLEWEALPASRRADELVILERAFVYLRSGAEGEVRKEIINLTEEHPDALRFAMQADCWNPTNFAAGRDRSDVWLKRFSGRVDTETRSVKSVQAYLGTAETRRQYVHDRAASTSWYPLGSVLLLLLLATGAVRLLP